MMQALKFHGSGGEYFKIWIVNILLTVVTIGLYYPWAKVRNKRYFYANSTLDNRNFEYHATGKQLFLGYLIAMALFVIYVVIQNISPAGSGVVLLIFFLGLPWVIWRSLKFNLRMTSFSNVRFSFNGDLKTAYINYLLLPIAFFLSFYIGPLVAGLMFGGVGESAGAGSGLMVSVLVLASITLAFYLFALMKKRNTIYTANGTRYGQGQFFADVKVPPFAFILLKTIGLAIAIFVLLGVIVGLLVSLIMDDGMMTDLLGLFNSENAEDVMAGGVFAMFGLLYFVFFIASFLVFAYSYSRNRRYIYDHTKLDDKVTFASTLAARPMAWIMITNLLAIVATLGLALPWAKVRMARFVLSNTMVDAEDGFDLYLTQQQDEQSPLGEQIGDAFDVDVGIGF